MRAQLFAKMDPTTEACGCMSTRIMGWRALPFRPPMSLPEYVQAGKFSLTSGVGPLSIYLSRAQLLPLALSLECLGENRASVSLHWTNTSCPDQEPIYLLPQLQKGKQNTIPVALYSARLIGITPSTLQQFT